MQEKSASLGVQETAETAEELAEEATKPKTPREFIKKEDFVAEMSERLLLSKNETIYHKVLDRIVDSGNFDITLEKYVDKNFSSILRDFPDLKDLYIFVRKEKCRRDRNNRKNRRRK